MRNRAEHDRRSNLEQRSQPGVHSHNRTRQPGAKAPRQPGLRWLRLLLLAMGLTGLGYYGWEIADQSLYQSYANWAFEQEIAGKPEGVRDWIMHTTPPGRWSGYAAPQRNAATGAAGTESKQRTRVPAQGVVLGRVEVPRLGLRAMVRQGADASTLRDAVGHVPSTQRAGAAGNFVIAAHRDTLFRKLKEIRIGDRVRFETKNNSFTYEVTGMKIVTPTDVSVLRPQGNHHLLTMITCYPFTYVGAAPERFVVSAEQVTESEPARAPAKTVTSAAARGANKRRREPGRRRSERALAGHIHWARLNPLHWSGG